MPYSHRVAVPRKSPIGVCRCSLDSSAGERPRAAGYIDILLLHHPASNDVSAYRAIEQAIRNGKVRSAGISCYYIRELDAFIPKVDLKPVLVQNEVHPYYQDT